ncbi:MAG TPA: class I SAM-dependent methyltransferase [Nitrospirales bacterium]|nr:class I SAM-dependent methyltransferase [Nitrospirales bacterium]
MCPLCQAENTIKICTDRHREYLRCQICQLIFVPPNFFLSADDEKARYDTHQNSPDDPKYRAFLSRLFIPMQNRLSPGSSGLDFGSGPGPTLSVLFEEAGHSMALYDHFYAPYPAVLDTPYDFITVTEVVEHLHHPREELDRLWTILKPGGILGIMTKLAPNQEAFAEWYYKRDPTHVCFFSRTTFEWLATQWPAALTCEENDVMLLEKTTEQVR